MDDHSTVPSSPAARGRRKWLAAGVVFALAVAGGAYVYATRGSDSAGGEGYCPTDVALDRLKPLAVGEVAAFSVASRPAYLPPLSFQTADGRKISLDEFKGRTVLLNLWATWCVPCRKEMPALDRLQQLLGGADFTVVAINLDTGRSERAGKWLRDNGITQLALYTDGTGTVMKTLQKSGQVVGLPTTLLLNRDGCQTGILKGGAEWSSDDAVRLIKAAVGRSD